MKQQLITTAVLSLLLAGAINVQAQNKVLYPYLMNPTEHPDYLRHYVKAPDYSVFGNKTQFMALRNLAGPDYKERISLWVDKNKLGNILWVSYPLIFQDNLKEVVSEIKKRNLYLFDLWGYVPGSGPGGAKIVSSCNGMPAVAEIPCGRGTITVIASPFAVPEHPQCALPAKVRTEQSLDKPYPMLKHVQAYMEDLFSGFTLFETDPELSTVTCVRNKDEYSEPVSSVAFLLNDSQNIGRNIDALKQMKVETLSMEALQRDIHGQLWNMNCPVCKYDGREAIARIVKAFPKANYIMDGLYDS